MPITSGFSGFPHFTQRLLLTTSTYSFYFIFFYANRERILRECTHGVWKRWVQICFYFLIMFFSLVRKERKGQKEERFPLLNSFCRLAATSANKVPRPSNRSLATATGSKRSSADSDLLLCHVRLWQTSRLGLWCGCGVRT